MVKASEGVTLLELMVVLAIVAILLLLAVPLGSAWIAGAQVAETKALLQQGYANARALALRNPAASSDGAPSAALKLDGDFLLVCKGDRSNSACARTDASGTVVWKTDVVRGTGVSVTVTSVNLSSRGIPDTTPSYSISKGSETENGNFDAD